MKLLVGLISAVALGIGTIFGHNANQETDHAAGLVDAAHVGAHCHRYGQAS